MRWCRRGGTSIDICFRCFRTTHENRLVRKSEPGLYVMKRSGCRNLLYEFRDERKNSAKIFVVFSILAQIVGWDCCLQGRESVMQSGHKSWFQPDRIDQRCPAWLPSPCICRSLFSVSVRQLYACSMCMCVCAEARITNSTRVKFMFALLCPLLLGESRGCMLVGSALRSRSLVLSFHPNQHENHMSLIWSQFRCNQGVVRQAAWEGEKRDQQLQVQLAWWWN